MLPSIMNRAQWIYLLSCSLTVASPRISMISPVSGEISGDPVVFDIDFDGDLDLAFLPREEVAYPHYVKPLAPPTWFEYLGNRRFSPPQSLGLPFNSSRRQGISYGFFLSSAKQTTEIATLVEKTVSGEIELHTKPIQSNAWKFIHRFEGIDKAYFLNSPVDDLRIIITQKGNRPDTLGVWEYTDEGELIQRQAMSAPSNIFKNVDLSRLRAADFDLDGDSDLLLINSGDTYIFERTGPMSFSTSSVAFSHEYSIIADYDGENGPDLFSQQFNLALNESNFSFSQSGTYLGGLFSNVLIGVGVTDGVPSMFGIDSSKTHLEVIERDPPNASQLIGRLNLDEKQIESPVVADFDQDGHSDIALILEIQPDFPTSYIPYSSPTFTSIPGIPRGIASSSALRPYQRLHLSWGAPETLNELVPAHPEAPIVSASPTAGDFNNDGSPDLIIGPNTEGLPVILLNDGSGHFRDSRVLTELYPASLKDEEFHLTNFVPVDWNNDGNLDLSYSIRESLGGISVHLEPLTRSVIALGNGDGKFEPMDFSRDMMEFNSNFDPGITEFRDWDGDGDLDAILSGAWRENINGTLQEQKRFLVANAAITDALGNPTSVHSQQIVDLDHDGFLDQLVPGLTRTPLNSPFLVGLGSYYSYNAGIAFGSDGGSLVATSDREATLLTYDPLGDPFVMPYLALDLNLDGVKEILISEASTDAFGNPIPSRIQQWSLDPTAPRDLSRALVLSFPTFSIPFSDQLLDFNGDGSLEYVSSDQYVTPTPDGALVSRKYSFRGDHLQPSYSALPGRAIGDFDQDGDIDTIYANGFSDLYLVRNTLVDEDSLITQSLTEIGLTPALATPEADPDLDGRSNALEILQGTDPQSPDSAPRDFIATKISRDGSFVSFNRRGDASDFQLYYDVQISSDLVHWKTIQTSPPTIIGSHGIWEQVSVEIPRNNRINYLRIIASHAPRR